MRALSTSRTAVRLECSDPARGVSGFMACPYGMLNPMV
jgi:hypothetical protein